MRRERWRPARARKLQKKWSRGIFSFWSELISWKPPSGGVRQVLWPVQMWTSSSSSWPRKCWQRGRFMGPAKGSMTKVQLLVDLERDEKCCACNSGLSPVSDCQRGRRLEARPAKEWGRSLTAVPSNLRLLVLSWTWSWNKSFHTDHIIIRKLYLSIVPLLIILLYCNSEDPKLSGKLFHNSPLWPMTSLTTRS